MVVARVRVWHDDEGWGVLDSAETPGGCWVHFSHLDLDGYRSLRDVDAVELEWEPARQDGYRFSAVRVRVPGGTSTLPGAAASRAYTSALTLEFDDGRVLRFDGGEGYGAPDGGGAPER